MSSQFLKLTSRTTLVLLELLAALFGVLLLCIGVFMWRLTVAPVHLDFVSSYVEDALKDPASGYVVSIGSVELQWPNLKGPVELSLGSAKLLKSGRAALSVDRIVVGLSRRHLIIGELRPVSIGIYGPTLHAIRTEDNHIHVGIADEIPTDVSAPSDQKSPILQIIDTLSTPPEKIDRRSPLGRLHRLEIHDAKLVTEDRALGITWYLPDMDLICVRDRKGVVINAELPLPGGRNDEGMLRGAMAYEHDQKEFLINFQLRDFNPQIISRKVEKLAWLNEDELFLNGDVSAHISSEMAVRSVEASFSAEKGALVLKGIYNKPMPFDMMQLQAAYDGATDQIDVRNLSLSAQGATVSASTKFALSSDAIEAPVRVALSDLQQAAIEPLWPDALHGDGSEVWLTKKISGGLFHDVSLTGNLNLTKGEDKQWTIAFKDMHGNFAFDDGNVDYRHPLPRAEHVSGTGIYENDKITIDVAKGVISNMKIAKGTVVLDKLSEHPGYAIIDLTLAGPLSSILDYLRYEPINMNTEKFSIVPAQSKGQAQMDVHVSLPMLHDVKIEEVKVAAEGTVTNASLPKLFHGMDFAGGPLTIKVADGVVDIGGSGTIGKYPVKVGVNQKLHLEPNVPGTKITASLSADPELRQKLNVDLGGFISGTFPAEVTYIETPGAASVAEITADLTGANLDIEQFDYHKAPGEKASGSAKAVFIKGGQISGVENLKVEAPNLAISGGSLGFEGAGHLVGAKLPQITLGADSFGLAYEAPVGKTAQLALSGKSMNAMPFLKHRKDSKPYTGPPLSITANAETLRTSAEGTVKNAKVSLELETGGHMRSLQFDAVAGQGNMSMRYWPNESGQMSVEIAADDAGAALTAFDIYKNVRGGKIKLTGRSNADNVKLLKGKAEMSDFQVVNAPALARLVNAISLTGIPELLAGGGGMSFSRLEADFGWQLRSEGDLYTFDDGRTSGSSLGLTFTGQIDRAAGQTDITGTIVPVTMVNQIVNNIPLIGDILAGGKNGAVFAATYSVTGPSQDPNVTVNPLSVLAPGILRKIFFGSSD